MMTGPAHVQTPLKRSFEKVAQVSLPIAASAVNSGRIGRNTVGYQLFDESAI